MSCKRIDITTSEGNDPTLIACRQVRHRAHRVGSPMSLGKVVGWTKTKAVVVQYGIGVSGNGCTLKEALANFRSNWSEFCASRCA